jgi:cbb3-type cytochrome oxidase maturation protein
MICSMVLAGGFLAAFIWADRSGQFDDDVSPAHRILFEQKLWQQKPFIMTMRSFAILLMLLPFGE